MTKITERGMIFNGEMVLALLDGRKTQTRRIMKPQPELCQLPKGGHWWSSNTFKTMLHIEEEMQNGKGGWSGLAGDACPFGAVGDRIWVRETFRVHSRATDVATLVYKGSEKQSWTQQTHRVPIEQCSKPAVVDKWTPSIHMPRWASRILLEITDVRVERLNSISEEDARAEGVKQLREGYWKHYQPEWTQFQLSARGSFVTLWESIYGADSWQANPWVWVIEFKRNEGGAK